jgi:hypothetical protein
MRTLLLAAVAIVSLTGVSAVQAADIYYEPAPTYGAAPPAYEPPPPPNYGPPPPPAYRPLPRYGYAQPPAYEPAPRYAPQPQYAPPPQAYGPPPAVAYDDDEEDVVAAPPPRVYRDAPVYAERPRYHRDCWWEWGQRRCAPRRGW